MKQHVFRLVFGVLLSWMLLNSMSLQRRIDQLHLQIMHLAGVEGRLNEIVLDWEQ